MYPETFIRRAPVYSYDLSGGNKYMTLYKGLRGDILGGKLRAGQKLPGKRTLARDLGVSVVTVQTAYEQLLAEGYIRSEERRGYFVCAADMAVNERPPTIPVAKEERREYAADFVGGSTPAELFPFSSWAKLMRGVLTDCGEHLLERVPAAGDGELRCALSDYLYRARGIWADPSLIVIGAGAEQLYDIIVRLVGRDRLYGIENPGYSTIRRSYASAGARCVPLPVGAEGMDCKAALSSGADVLHISPAHQFPTGAVMPVTARAKLISYADGRDGYIVEDDYDSEFRLVGKPLQPAYALCPDRVIYVNTFSKTLAPSMRMGYMVLPRGLAGRYFELFGDASSSVPLFEQRALARMIAGGTFERHINRLRNYYRGVREVLLSKLGELACPHSVCENGAGLHFTVKFPSASDGEIKSRALAAGINLRCLSDYLIAPREDCACTAVINYSGITLDRARALDLKNI